MITNIQKANYAVGFYWNNVDGSVGCYAHGSEVHYGTMQEAQNFRKYCQNNSDHKDKNYKIFQLVEVAE